MVGTSGGKRQSVMDRYRRVHEEMRARHGFTVKALWGSAHSQRARFGALVFLLEGEEPFSLLDLGCGLCDFYAYLHESGLSNFRYHGVDIDANFIAEAKRRYPQLQLLVGSVEEAMADGRHYDYAIASGLYNLGATPRQAESLFFRQFEQLWPALLRGFAVNFLSTYSDRQDGVSVYHDPARLLRLCMHFSRRVALDHSYLPHDFTVYVRK